jgi:uncharacterized integral membrane protein
MVAPPPGAYESAAGSAEATGGNASPAPAPKVIPTTRASRAWLAVVPALILVTATLLFVLQNLRTAKVSFVTLSGTLPMGVALLGAVALGALLVLAVGSVRIVQLRRLVRRNHRGAGDARS